MSLEVRKGVNVIRVMSKHREAPPPRLASYLFAEAGLRLDTAALIIGTSREAHLAQSIT